VALNAHRTQGESSVPGPGTELPRLALRPVLVVILVKTALHLAVAGRYGWQRDELYYWVSGQHLQGGYVEFPPVTALLSALSRVLFGGSLVGLRAFAFLAGAASVLVAALVTRELRGTTRAQLFAAVMVAFSPLLIATNGLFQPVSFDQLATLLVLWLALRLALGGGSWPLLGVAVGIALETKYTVAVVLVVLVVTFALFRWDLLRSRGFVLAVVIAAALVVPNLLWLAQHDWVSVQWFLDPPPSATDESRPTYILFLLLFTGLITAPVAVAGVVRLARDPASRPLGWAVVGVVVTYFLLGGKSYYAMPVMLFALAAGAVPFAAWVAAGSRRLVVTASAYGLMVVALLPIGLPVLPLRTAIRLGITDARTDYADELGWPALARTVESVARDADVVLALNFGEAGALERFGRGLPPVASGHVTYRFWRPKVDGRRAVLVGLGPGHATFCHGYRVVARISMPVDNEEQGRPIARCDLDGSLADVWPRVLDLYG